MASSDQLKLRGVIPPLVTPLLNDDELDVVGCERLIEHLLNGGVHGLFILGTTGEAPSISPRLQRELVALTAKLVSGRAPVVVGITSSSLRESIDLANFAADNGAEAVVATTPFYFEISQTELLNYTRKLASSISLPLVLYNIPQRSGVTFETETVRQLFENERISGIKDSSGDFVYFEQILALAADRQDLSVLMGQEALIEKAVLAGAHGGVPGSGNAFPATFAGLYESCLAGDQGRIEQYRAAISAIHRMFYSDFRVSSDGIGPVKFALGQMGIGNGVLASPLSFDDEAKMNRISAALHVFQQEFGHLINQPAVAI